MAATEKIAVIFDMDGVIIHSNPLITTAWRKFFTEVKIDLDDEQLKHYVFGCTSADTIKMVFNKAMPAAQIKAYQHIIESNVQALYMSDGLLIPGFKPFVETLLQNDIAVAIATAAPSGNVKVVLEMADAAHLFQVITNADHVHNSKPHPEVYLKTAEKLNVEPANCVVFEDSVSGIQSAKNAGMKVIGVTTTHSVDELSAQTDAVINDFTEASIGMVKNLLN